MMRNKPETLTMAFCIALLPPLWAVAACLLFGGALYLAALSAQGVRPSQLIRRRRGCQDRPPSDRIEDRDRR